MATRGKGVENQPAKTDRRWHAVSVKPTTGACPAAISGKDRRWLSREAPALPLPGCTRPDTCHCTYQHHEDRRAGGRRDEDIDGFARQPKVTNERRKRGDRRTKRNGQ